MYLDMPQVPRGEFASSFAQMWVGLIWAEQESKNLCHHLSSLLQIVILFNNGKEKIDQTCLYIFRTENYSAYCRLPHIERSEKNRNNAI